MKPKPIKWMGSSKKDLMDLPGGPRCEIGHALYLAQIGEKSPNSKPLPGLLQNVRILEILENDEAGTYRAVHTIELKDVVVVLHVFQKKSKTGKKMTQQDIELIKSRYKRAVAEL
jgi:phage-related protein